MKTILQASDLKKHLQGLKITKKNSTPASLDIEDFYPSVKFSLVEDAVLHFFSKGVSKEEKVKIKHCLDMIKFGMSSTLITFIDKYYEYDGHKEVKDKGLTIGGYESAWLADLVGAYILKKTKHLFNHTRYHGIYRDDGFIVFIGDWTYQDMVIGGTISKNKSAKSQVVTT